MFGSTCTAWLYKLLQVLHPVNYKELCCHLLDKNHTYRWEQGCRFHYKLRGKKQYCTISLLVKTSDKERHTNKHEWQSLVFLYLNRDSSSKWNADFIQVHGKKLVDVTFFILYFVCVCVGEVPCYPGNVLCSNSIYQLILVDWSVDVFICIVQFSWTHSPLFMCFSSRDLQTKSSVIVQQVEAWSISDQPESSEAARIHKIKTVATLKDCNDWLNTHSDRNARHDSDKWQ